MAFLVPFSAEVGEVFFVVYPGAFYLSFFVWGPFDGSDFGPFVRVVSEVVVKSCNIIFIKQGIHQKLDL